VAVPAQERSRNHRGAQRAQRAEGGEDHGGRGRGRGQFN
jgi:hypothetical protein